METVGHSEMALTDLSWAPVRLEGTELLAKAWFGDTQYRVLLSDLRCVWEEDMRADVIADRAQELNKRLRAPADAVFSHLRSVALPLLSGQSHDTTATATATAAHFTVHSHDDRLTVRLKSELVGVPFHWEFRLRPAPVTVVCKQLVRPLLVMTRLLQRQVTDLSGLLGRKDAEIQDYKENGATLTRERLLTDAFDEDRYRQNFLSQMLPQLGALQECVDFGPELQALYTAVSCSSSTQRGGGGARKRRRSSSSAHTPTEEDDDATLIPDQAAGANTHMHQDAGVRDAGIRSSSSQSLTPSLLDQNPEERGSRGASGEPQNAEGEQTVPQMPVPSHRPAAPAALARPKKKKEKGLFR
ncbi:non-homologous end-joining factor 1 [Engraulis encrasicolus]|uniref:non-homologous end-joining factor 1 n=1 Tax=Engraulis encrasicolus TaxID=184585 RepID=UPI002FD10B41